MRHKLPNDLGLNILGNQKYQKKIEIKNIKMRKYQAILEKSQIAVKKTRKSRYQAFLFRYSFTGPHYLAPNTLSKIVLAVKFLVITWPSFLQASIFFYIFYNFKAFLQSLRKYIKQISCIKVPNLMVLCKYDFAQLVQVKMLPQKFFNFAYQQFFLQT